MERGKARHMFPGGNTSLGFYSYYNYILPQREAEHIFCLKGGPGVGKSTFMKEIGSRMQDEGIDTEYMHCSSDPDSLDGVLFPKLHVALIDGTAPHVTDPQNPGAVDEIINLGECWNLVGIKAHRQQIIDINAEVKRQFRRAYGYISAAKNIMDDITETFGLTAGKAVDSVQARMISEKELLKEAAGRPGKERKMFASAITPSGIVNYIDTLYGGEYKTYLMMSNMGAGVSGILTRIALEARERGFDTEQYYCPMEPEKRMEHLIIPGLKLAFLSENKYLSFDCRPDVIVDMTQYADPAFIGANEDALEFDAKEFDALMGEAVSTLRYAKEAHDEMEKYYIPNMDFSSEKKKREEILGRILVYVKK
jgi:hypothetical protein